MKEFWAVDYVNDSAVYDSGRNYACASIFFFFSYLKVKDLYQEQILIIGQD